MEDTNDATNDAVSFLNFPRAATPWNALRFGFHV